MTILVTIQLLMLMNGALFTLVFVLLAPPPGVLRVVSQRLSRELPGVSGEALHRLSIRVTGLYGVVGCVALFGWAMLTGFVVALYRGGFFRSL